MTLRILALALCLLPAGWTATYADDDGGEHGGRRAALVVTDPLTKTECSACHMAYPAALLPARSWTALMADLPNHFGEDASLDEASRGQIESYLVANAADSTGAGRALRGLVQTDTPLRISELPWFKRKHADEVSPRMLEKARSMSNCAACHTGAERGLFDDD
ncbi:DHC, diheme cytochrome c precursor [Cereibacter sphaeroides WS8N]|uniref:diheme cytochrome c n=1 Tax=Cereibacter sphaeroides TaxID=1063 RepID=UPI00020DF40C|nr:diheme cytochrome c [Cereibacter sphaeroides]EGJ20481.1 DHC, diheme cytochrome c precursor [Cereibacter sphaeroides WS8N]